MPSPMLHLMTAYKFDKNATIPFFIGNISPDWISERYEKDKSHFRDREDRMEALMQLAQCLDMKDDYCKGVVLHLFLDFYWDTEALGSFIKNHTDENWFLPYRHEIALAGNWAFYHIPWSKSLWEQMIAYPMEELKTIHGIHGVQVKDFVNRNHQWYLENVYEASKVFTPEYVENFTNRVAKDYRKWLENF